MTIQNTFYGYLDAAGFIHDSIFLPLGVMSFILRAILIIGWGSTKLFEKSELV
jgi:hypothetical protein